MAAMTWMMMPPRDVPMKAAWAMSSAVSLDPHVVVLPVAVAIGLAASAVVEGDHAAGCLRPRREVKRERVEIARVACQPRQADDGQGGFIRLAVDAGMQPQPVLGRIEEVAEFVACHRI
jgi:hypothetical protein